MNYLVKVTKCEIDRDRNICNEEVLDRSYIGSDFNEARQVMLDKFQALEDVKYKDEAIEASVWTCVISEDYDDGEDILDYVAEVEMVDERLKEYEYRKLDGAIVLYWAWDKYVGYARKFKDIEYYYGNGDESLCIEKDEAFTTQMTVIAWPEEYQDMDKDDIATMVCDRIDDLGIWIPSLEAIAALNDISF